MPQITSPPTPHPPPECTHPDLPFVAIRYSADSHLFTHFLPEAETGPSRQWLLQAQKADEIVEKLRGLLGSADEGTASNAALGLARIAGSQEGRVKLLGHPRSQHLLRQLIASLRAEEAGGLG